MDRASTDLASACRALLRATAEGDRLAALRRQLLAQAAMDVCRSLATRE